jgi:hypothetical protein
MDTNAILLCVKRLGVDNTAHHTTPTRHLAANSHPKVVPAPKGSKRVPFSLICLLECLAMQGKEAIQDFSPAMTKERSFELKRKENGGRMGGAKNCCL